MKYASYNSQDTNNVTPVTGWYDCDVIDYPVLPTDRVVVAQSVWDDVNNRCNGGYSVDKSATPAIVSTPGYVPYTPPV